MVTVTPGGPLCLRPSLRAEREETCFNKSPNTNSPHCSDLTSIFVLGRKAGRRFPDVQVLSRLLLTWPAGEFLLTFISIQRCSLGGNDAFGCFSFTGNSHRHSNIDGAALVGIMHASCASQRFKPWDRTWTLKRTTPVEPPPLSAETSFWGGGCSLITSLPFSCPLICLLLKCSWSSSLVW